MPDEFVPLAVSVRERGSQSIGRAARQAASDGDASRSKPEETQCAAEARDALVREVARMRLAAFEAFERLRDRLLTRLAGDVLARELELGPSDIQALTERTLGALREEEPVCVVVCASDAERIACELPVRAAATLRPGDLIVEVRDGEIDARFDLRLGAALESVMRAGGSAS